MNLLAVRNRSKIVQGDCAWFMQNRCLYYGKSLDLQLNHTALGNIKKLNVEICYHFQGNGRKKLRKHELIL